MHDRSVTIEVPDTQGSSVEPSNRRSRVPLLIAAAVLVVLVGVIAGVIASRGDDSTDVDASLGAQQLASIQQACAQWYDGHTGSAAPSSAWCDDMVDWMTDQVRSRQMMGSMMWSDPDQMLATCQQWMSSSTTAGGSTPNGSAWCGQMVTWMTQHMGDWDRWDRGWMMNGPMMGG